MTLLERAKALGAEAQEAIDERVAADADLLPKRERKRAEREGADTAKRAARRARTARARRGRCGSAACGCATSRACSTAPRTSSTRPTASTRCAPTPRAATYTACARPSLLVDDTRAAFAVNASEELQLEALAFALARTLRRRD